MRTLKNPRRITLGVRSLPEQFEQVIWLKQEMAQIFRGTVDGKEKYCRVLIRARPDYVARTPEEKDRRLEYVGELAREMAVCAEMIHQICLSGELDCDDCPLYPRCSPTYKGTTNTQNVIFRRNPAIWDFPWEPKKEKDL